MSIRNFFLKKVLALSFLLLVLLECILGASVLLCRDHLLRNAQSMGMLLTKSHAREIETQLNEYSTLLQMAKVNIQKMQQEQADKSAFLTQVKKHLRHANATLVIIDLDNFKKVNNLYGHDQGDAVLRQTASLLSSTFRSTDLVGRFGGDEFMVLIPKHLDEQVLNRKFSHLCDSLNQISLQYPQANLSMSIGAGYCLKGADYEKVFKQVDETLYQVKRSGKNSFQIHRPEHGAAHSKG